jgi:hypothetical protein
MNIRTIDMFFSCEQDGESRIKAQDDVKEAKYMKINELKEDDFGLDSMKIAIRIIKNGAEMQK